MRCEFPAAIQKWLFVFYIFALACVCAPSYAEGGYVVDPVIAVPANSYTTFSTVYNGKRYYMGVDTVRVKGVLRDTIKAYDAPNYKTMWIAGPMWSPTGEILRNKDYTRTVKNVWLAELVVPDSLKSHRDRCYLTIADPETAGATYSKLVLGDEAHATMWHTAKDMTNQDQQMHGWTYFYSDATGVDVYRYMAYDPLFGYTRLFSTRPALSQRISVWDRKTGNDVTSTITPNAYTFGLNTEADTVKLPITSRVYYYKNMDRFRSRYNQMDIFVNEPTVESNQATLLDQNGAYQLRGWYEWSSNPRGGEYGSAYDGKSTMKYYTLLRIDSTVVPESDPVAYTYTPVFGWTDSTMLWVSERKFSLNTTENLWHDTIFAIGPSPFNMLRKRSEAAPEEEDYVDHSAWLRQHFEVKACKECAYEHFVDSILITRQTFHNDPFTTMRSSVSPVDHVFEYKDAGSFPVTAVSDTALTFGVAIRYQEGNTIHYANHAVARTVIGEERDLDIHTRPAYRDPGTGLWYDTLTVEALNADGTSALYNSSTNPTGWIESVYLKDLDSIRVRVCLSSATQTANRVAQIRYRYCYRHSSIVGDTVETVRSIWITQKGYQSTSASLYTFKHKTGTDAPQEVHTKRYTFYAIPGEELSLPIHRDHWGYYRWYEWDYRGGTHEVDPANSQWTWVEKPKNQQSPINMEYMPINNVTDGSSRGRWDIMDHDNTFGTSDHFTPGLSTAIPSVMYPESNSKTDSIACDVSAYTDINTHGQTIGGLKELTEPTLSYRNIFTVRPAKEQADKMATHRTGGTWMENYNILVPAGRAFNLIQQYPVLNSENDVVEAEHLQYIYYFNTTGKNDENMGTKGDLNDTKAASYGRIGEPRYTGSATRTAQLLTKDEIDALGESGSIKVLVVNARKTSGYVLGKKAGEEEFTAGSIGTKTNTDDLKDYLETMYLNPSVQGNYELTLTKNGSGSFVLSHKDATRGLWYYYDGWQVGRRVRWIMGSGSITGTNTITYSHPESVSDASRISGGDGNLLQFYMSYWGAGAHGYLTASTGSGSYPANLHINNDQDGDASNQYWLVYKIVEPDQVKHQETPVWEYSTDGSSWDTVAVEGTNNASYKMLADGSLSVGATVHPTSNLASAVYYRLRTEHFQLAKFAVRTTNPATDGPSKVAIISEDSIQNHFDILFTLGNETFDAPRTTDTTAYYHHMPWSFTELSYHYPLRGEHKISKAQRTDTLFLPEKGQYCYINKFIDPTNSSNIIESMDGAAKGYMLCIHASQKPVTVFDFEYPQMPCSDQDIYLTANICNPVNNGYNPQFTADLEGWNGSAWVPIYRYKTGEIPYESSQRWYQLAIPIAQERLAGYQKFRCVAALPGSMEDNAYLLMDRVRFIAKERPVAVYQNKTTCLSDNKVDIVARIDYRNSTFPAGTLVAFQYQKKVGNTYVPLASDKMNGYFIEGMTDEEIAADDVWLKDVNGDRCGMIMIPSGTYNPSSSNSDLQTVVHGIRTKMGDDDATATTNAANYANESGLVTSLELVQTKKKSYVNEGANDSDKAYYVMCLSCKVDAAVGDTFRVAMMPMRSLGTVPNFSTAGCATERIVTIKNPVTLNIDGSGWTNRTRAALEEAAGDPDPVEANDTYRLSVTLQNAPDGATATGCKFDLLRSYEWDRDYEAKYRAWLDAVAGGNEETIASKLADVTAANNAFKTAYGVTRTQILEILEIFRADNENNPTRLVTNWNDVRPEDFMWSGRSQTQADSIYSVLNRLIVKERKLEIGLDYYDVFLGNNQDAYAYIQPIPGSGYYIKGGETYDLAACNTPQWFEMHSKASNYTLRFGYDNIVNGNYEVPVIRACGTDANAAGENRLSVRVAEIASSAATDTVILGWEKTVLVESNDPEWLADPSKVFKYQQDIDMRTHKPEETTYYTKGDVIRFKAADGNTISLKAGYWYTFRTGFYGASKSAVYSEPGADPTNFAEFILAVAPDTVYWTPSHPESANYWNDDDNWTAIVNGADFKACIAPIPHKDTKVIIPAPGEENLLPIVSPDSVLVARRVDTLDYGFVLNTCQKILFKPRATMLGQENLDYERAYVDVLFTTGNWQTFSPALKEIYSGDMFIPYASTYVKGSAGTGASVDTVDFAPKAFSPVPGESWTYNPRIYPFAFYQGFYNSSVSVSFHNTDKDGNPVEYTYQQSKNVADWVKTNLIDTLYHPGGACVIMGYDETDADGREIVVRLPKPDTQYYTYGKYNGSYVQSASARSVSKTSGKNLAYDKTTLGASDGITYTLHNATESEIFFFGNPTMALIDVYQLCLDNAGVLLHDGTTHHFTAYQLIDGTTSSYTIKEISGPGQYFVAPQRTVGLIANDTQKALKTLPIKLRPEALVALTGDGIVVSREAVKSEPSKIVMRRATAATPPKRLYICAANETDEGVKKAYLTLGEEPGADRGYRKGEDALSLSSGENYFSYSSFSTPLSLYSVADNEALMLDIRDTLRTVPLVMATLDERFEINNRTVLSFAIEGTWEQPLYLYDALTGDSVMILNGLQVAVETPLSNQLRYYINGYAAPQSEQQQGTTTGVEVVSGEDANTLHPTPYTIIYDVLGRRLMTLSEHDLITTCSLPTGVYIIQRGNKTERMVVR